MPTVRPAAVAEPEPVTVHVRDNRRYPGVRSGRVAAYDFPAPDKLEVYPGAPRQQRAYLLLDESVQLQQPAWFVDHPGWWYVDLVDITETDRTIQVTDQKIDIIIGPPGYPYRMLDLDEFGQAIMTGRLSPSDGARMLAATQAFLDRHLHRRHDLALAWPDFPPAALAVVRNVEIPLA